MLQMHIIYIYIFNIIYECRDCQERRQFGLVCVSVTGCCTSDNKVPSVVPDGCIPIPVPKNDPYLSHFAVTCTPMMKSVTSTERGCDLKPDQQVSTVLLKAKHKPFDFIIFYYYYQMGIKIARKIIIAR